MGMSQPLAPTCVNKVWLGMSYYACFGENQKFYFLAWKKNEAPKYEILEDFYKWMKETSRPLIRAIDSSSPPDIYAGSISTHLLSQ